MKIIEALKETAIRISYGDRWLVWDMIREEWQVCYRNRGQKYTRIAESTKDEELAVKVLLGVISVSEG